MTIDKYDFVRAILLLDAADDALKAAAALEHRRERGKEIRQITAQQRATATAEFVREMSEKYEVDL